MNIKPLFDRVIVLPKIDENKTKSGLVLPETSQERPQIGEVVAIGDGDSFDASNVGMKLSIGDKVLFNKYAGTELKYEEKTYIIMRQIDVIGVIYE